MRCIKSHWINEEIKKVYKRKLGQLDEMRNFGMERDQIKSKCIWNEMESKNKTR